MAEIDTAPRLFQKDILDMVIEFCGDFNVLHLVNKEWCRAIWRNPRINLYIKDFSCVSYYRIEKFMMFSAFSEYTGKDILSSKTLVCYADETNLDVLCTWVYTFPGIRMVIGNIIIKCNRLTFYNSMTHPMYGINITVYTKYLTHPFVTHYGDRIRYEVDAKNMHRFEYLTDKIRVKLINSKITFNLID